MLIKSGNLSPIPRTHVKAEENGFHELVVNTNAYTPQYPYTYNTHTPTPLYTIITKICVELTANISIYLRFSLKFH